MNKTRVLGAICAGALVLSSLAFAACGSLEGYSDLKSEKVSAKKWNEAIYNSIDYIDPPADAPAAEKYGNTFSFIYSEYQESGSIVNGAETFGDSRLQVVEFDGKSFHVTTTTKEGEKEAETTEYYLTVYGAKAYLYTYNKEDQKWYVQPQTNLKVPGISSYNSLYENATEYYAGLLESLAEAFTFSDFKWDSETKEYVCAPTAPGETEPSDTSLGVKISKGLVVGLQVSMEEKDDSSYVVGHTDFTMYDVGGEKGEHIELPAAEKAKAA